MTTPLTMSAEREAEIRRSLEEAKDSPESAAWFDAHTWEDIAALLRELAATRERLEGAVDVALGCRMTEPSPIGPLHGAGWNEVVDLIAKRLHWYVRETGSTERGTVSTTAPAKAASSSDSGEGG